MDNHKSKIIFISNDYINIEQSICNYLISQLGGKIFLEALVKGLEDSPVGVKETTNGVMVFNQEFAEAKQSMIEGLKEVLKRKDLQQQG
jgi:hypothetical protein